MAASAFSKYEIATGRVVAHPVRIRVSAQQVAGDDGAALAGGQGTAESGGFGADCHYRREGVLAVGVTAGASVSGSSDSDGVDHDKSQRCISSRYVRKGG